MAIEKIVMCLPLEFRGNDPVRTLLHYLMVQVDGPCFVQGLRRNMEMVIEFMIDSDGRGVRRVYPRCISCVRVHSDYHSFTHS